MELPIEIKELVDELYSKLAVQSKFESTAFDKLTLNGLDFKVRIKKTVNPEDYRCDYNIEVIQKTSLEDLINRTEAGPVKDALQGQLNEMINLYGN